MAPITKYGSEHQLNRKLMQAKQKHKRKILEYLANPDNEIPCREELASVCGIKRVTLYFHFTPDELSELETEGLEMRRKKYAPRLSKVDIALLERAASGDPQAAKLAYQRFEGWQEKAGLEVGGTLKIEVVDYASSEAENPDTS